PPPNPQNPAGFFHPALMIFSGDSQLVAVGGNQGNSMCVRLWQAASGQELPRWTCPQNTGFQGMVFSPDGKTLAVYDGSQTTRYLETATAHELRHATGRSQFGAFAEAFAPDSQTVAGVNGDNILLEDAVTGKAVRQFPARHHGVTALAFAPNGQV